VTEVHSKTHIVFFRALLVDKTWPQCSHRNVCGTCANKCVQTFFWYNMSSQIGTKRVFFPPQKTHGFFRLFRVFLVPEKMSKTFLFFWISRIPGFPDFLFFSCFFHVFYVFYDSMFFSMFSMFSMIVWCYDVLLWCYDDVMMLWSYHNVMIKSWCYGKVMMLSSYHNVIIKSWYDVMLWWGGTSIFANDGFL